VWELGAHAYPLQYFSVTQVDLVEGHTEIEDKIERLLIEIPKLELRDIISLEVKG